MCVGVKVCSCCILYMLVMYVVRCMFERDHMYIGVVSVLLYTGKRCVAVLVCVLVC